MKKIISPSVLLFLFFAFFMQSLKAASVSVSGNARVGSNLFSELDLSDAGDSTTSFLNYRFLLRPEFVLDSRFSIKTELNLNSYGLRAAPGNPLAQPYLNNGTPLSPNSFVDTSLPNPSDFETQSLELTQAYLEWASDYGLFHFGRMPKSWGCLLYTSPSPRDQRGSRMPSSA